MSSVKEQKDANAKINALLKNDKSRLEKEIKLLLLGTGESGKSTIAKQLKIIHLEGFPEAERVNHKNIIYVNILFAIKTLINAAKTFKYQLSPEMQELAAKISSENYFSGGVWTPEMGKEVKTLWLDRVIQQTFERQNEFQLYDSAKYYFDNVDRISEVNYVPSEQDLLRCRVKTTGILETEFVLERRPFKIVDVGGQRSERRKWIHCFQDVTAIIFCVAISEYDLKLVEDENTNRMHESLNIFRDIINNKFFANTPIILFLNKRDLFQDKIKRTNLTICFPEFPGPQTFEAAAKYIENKFVEQSQNTKKAIYPHLTCATDTNNITHVFNAVTHIILTNNLSSAGFNF